MCEQHRHLPYIDVYLIHRLEVRQSVLGHKMVYEILPNTKIWWFFNSLSLPSSFTTLLEKYKGRTGNEKKV